MRRWGGGGSGGKTITHAREKNVREAYIPTLSSSSVVTTMLRTEKQTREKSKVRFNMKRLVEINTKDIFENNNLDLMNVI